MSLTQTDSPAERGGGDAWVSIKEFASHFGLGESTVRHWCTQGKIPTIRLFGVIRIPRHLLDEENWMDGDSHAS